jgi:hypothetical protein
MPGCGRRGCSPSATDRECEQAIEDGGLMLVLDGLAMSYGWAVDVDSLGAAPS